LAEQFVYHGRFPTALECAEELLAVAPEQYWLHAIKAHALMFLNHDDEAQDLYLRYERYRDGKATPELTWKTVILEDFAKMRNAGLSHPLMDEIEQELLG
jgi:predicted Zn-dependent protease